MAEPALPQRPETTPVVRPFQSPPTLSPQAAASPALPPQPPPALSRQRGPKNETSRIPPQPERPATAVVQTTSGTLLTSMASDASDSIPQWFCWGLLGISALIFLIQIWNYTLS